MSVKRRAEKEKIEQVIKKLIKEQEIEKRVPGGLLTGFKPGKSWSDTLKDEAIELLVSYVKEYGSLFNKKKKEEVNHNTSQTQKYEIEIDEKKTAKRPESMEAAIVFQKKIADLKGSNFGEFSDNIRNIVGEYYGTKLRILYPYNLEEDVSFPDWINADGDIVVIVGNKKNPDTGEESLEARVVKNIYSHQFYSYPKTGLWSWPVELKEDNK